MQDILIASSTAVLLVVVIFWDLVLFKKIHNQPLYKSVANKLKHITTMKKSSAHK